MNRRPPRTFRPSIDSLDQRNLLSGGVTASLSGAGVLTIRGTDAAETINLNVQHFKFSFGNFDFVSIEGVPGAYSTSQIRAIDIDAGGGDDRISINDGGYWSSFGSPQVTLAGGAGNDIIHGGALNDRILGGAGDDQLWGHGGVDTLIGGNGNDTLNGVAEVPTPTPPPPTNPTPVPDGSTSDPSLSAMEQRIFDLVNVERQRAGLAPLRLNSKLVQAAKLQSDNMVQFGVMSHTISGAAQPTLLDRLDYVGYWYWSAGENIAYGYSGADAVMSAWMSSPGHRANILNSSFTEIGVGVSYDAYGRPYYTQVFGRPA